jgi:hypothetical protein
MESSVPSRVKKAVGKYARVSTITKPQKPYISNGIVPPKSFLVNNPFRPNKSIAAKATTKCGVTIGKVAIVLKKSFAGKFAFATEYAKT